jgi:WD40 repeat protein
VNKKVFDTSTGEQLLDLSQTMNEKPLRIVVQHLVGFDIENRPLATAHEPKANARPLVRFHHDGTWEPIIADLGQHGYAAALSPDGRLLAIADELRTNQPEGIAIWDLADGKKRKQLGGHWQNIGRLEFSLDGKQLASVEQGGGVVKLWSLEDILAGELSPQVERGNENPR